MSFRRHGIAFVILLACVHFGIGAQLALADDDGKLRIVCFGAHPDDAEFKAGGVAAKWAALGHHVKFVSVTNGDIGHWQIAGGPLARAPRRRSETSRQSVWASKAKCSTSTTASLLPTLENRRTITRVIRDWKADVVMSHRPNDYHPDHRYTGVLVQDAAFMVTVPFFCPDTPPLEKNPAFFYLLRRLHEAESIHGRRDRGHRRRSGQEARSGPLAAIAGVRRRRVRFRGLCRRRSQGRRRPPGLGARKFTEAATPPWPIDFATHW